MAHEDDRLALAVQPGELLGALLAEGVVDHREDLVEDIDVRGEADGGCEREPRLHAARVALDRSVEVALDPGELRDPVHLGRIAWLLSPRMVPSSTTFSRPVSSGWKPAPTSSSGMRRPQTSIFPVSCIAIPEISWVSVDLPDPLAPTMPKNSPRRTSKLTSESAQKRSQLVLAADERAQRVLQAELLAEAVALADALAADGEVRTAALGAVRLRHSPQSGSPSARTRTSPAARRPRSRRAATPIAKQSGAMPSSDQRHASISPEAGLKARTLANDPAALSGYPTGVRKIPAWTTSGANATASRKRPPSAVTSSVTPHINTSSQTTRTGMAQRLRSEVAADRRCPDRWRRAPPRVAEAPRSGCR